MKTSLILLAVTLGIASVNYMIPSDEKPGAKDQDNPLQQISSRQMDANNIATWYRNNGGFNRNPVTGNSGFEWPKGSNIFARYASGLWIGAEVGDDTLIAIAEYDYEYRPGYIDENGNPQGHDDSLYRVYVINKGETNSYDYLHWPFSQGAYADAQGNPFIIGDQTMFFSFTDGYPEAHQNNAGTTAPLKAQILQTNWSFVKGYGPLDNIILSEQRIINRGNLPWYNCYFAIWADDDVGDANDDAVGCDTVLNLGYTYNGDNDDPQYGLAPPSVGFMILRGPLIPSAEDTARYFSPPASNNLRVFPGYRVSGMSAFTMYLGGNPSYGDPSNYRETYRNFQGIRKDGTYWINPVNGQVTSYAFSGDPSTGTGWYETDRGDRRFLQSMGPCTVNPGDTQSIVTAQIIGKGITNYSSINIIKQYSSFLKRFYESNFQSNVIAMQPSVTAQSHNVGRVSLSWNDSCEKVSYANPFSGGTYNFQGYNVYRIRPNNLNPSKSDTILIKTFDKVDGIKDIRDSIYLNEYEGIVYGIVQRGSDNGIARSIMLEKDTVSGGAFINGSEYKYSVSAYYYDPAGGLFTLPKLLASSVSGNIFKVVPQSIAPEARLFFNIGDTVVTNQGDRCFSPVVENLHELIDAVYSARIGFGNGLFNWTLTRSDFPGDTTQLISSPVNFSSVPDSAVSLDGMILYQTVVKDSGVVRDADELYGIKYSMGRGFKYIPDQNLWFTGPDTNAVKTAKVITNRQFQNRSIGMSFPTSNTFKNVKTRIIANSNSFSPVAGQNAILSGGPLRKIEIVFGVPSKSYRYVPADTTMLSAPYANFVDLPFSVYAVDELDSSNGAPRQLNTAFVDFDNDGLWNPDTSALGNYHFTYILASSNNSAPQQDYTTKDALSASFVNGLRVMDVMYAWLPRAKKKADGTPMTFANGDRLTVYPYRITKPEFVPGYPLKYSWEVKGTNVSASNVTSAEIASINVFPNPYYGTSELEYDSGGEKFIYFSNLPLQSTIYIYTLDGVPVRKILRSTDDPNSSLQKWDLKNNNGSYVASGMYIVYVDCGSAGGKTLKIAVFN